MAATDRPVKVAGLLPGLGTPGGIGVGIGGNRKFVRRNRGPRSPIMGNAAAIAPGPPPNPGPVVPVAEAKASAPAPAPAVVAGAAPVVAPGDGAAPGSPPAPGIASAPLGAATAPGWATPGPPISPGKPPGGATGSGPGCLPGRPGYCGAGRGAIHPNRPCFSTDPSHSNGLRSCVTDPLVPTPELKPEVSELGRFSVTPGPIIGGCDELAPGANSALACGPATGRLTLVLGSSCAFAAQLVQAANPTNVSVPSPFQFLPIFREPSVKEAWWQKTGSPLIRGKPGTVTCVARFGS